MVQLVVVGHDDDDDRALDQEEELDSGVDEVHQSPCLEDKVPLHKIRAGLESVYSVAAAS